jgi:hypothetical protein
MEGYNCYQDRNVVTTYSLLQMPAIAVKSKPLLAEIDEHLKSYVVSGFFTSSSAGLHVRPCSLDGDDTHVS